jgi:plasmid replication initiation protein
VDYLHVDKNYGETPFIPIEDFKTLMGIPDDMHRQFKMLNRRVIKEPVEEINGKTDFKVKVEYRKEGRKVAAVKFRIRRLLPIPSKSTRMREQSADDPTPDIVTELARVGVSRNKAVENAHSIEFSGKLL